MIRRLMPILLAALVIVVGLVGAQEPPAEPGDPPFRLKKKKRAPDVPPVKQPDKKDKDKAPTPAKDKQPDKDKDKAKEKEDPLEPEDGPGGTPEEDDKEVLERISRNVRGVEEKLGNRELGDPTSQQQRDILKDLDSLLRKKQQSEGGGGGGGADQQPQNGEQDKQDQKQKGSRSQSRPGQAGEKSGMSRSQQRKQQRQQRQKRGQRSGQRMGQGKGQAGNQPNPQPMPDGSNPGAGGKKPENPKNLAADLYKDVWGHLPESLRAEMDAYSNPSPFLPRYDDLINKYYRTIAEQGRKKGD